MPRGTIRIKSDCPWHIQEGGKDYPEEYYDKNGKKICFQPK